MDEFQVLVRLDDGKGRSERTTSDARMERTSRRGLSPKAAIFRCCVCPPKDFDKLGSEICPGERVITRVVREYKERSNNSMNTKSSLYSRPEWHVSGIWEYARK